PDPIEHLGQDDLPFRTVEKRQERGQELGPGGRRPQRPGRLEEHRGPFRAQVAAQESNGGLEQIAACPLVVDRGECPQEFAPPLAQEGQDLQPGPAARPVADGGRIANRLQQFLELTSVERSEDIRWGKTGEATHSSRSYARQSQSPRFTAFLSLE